MNTLWIVVIAAVIIYLAYNFYAKQIDKNVIKADPKKATPAKMYMDGVDFMPTSRNVLYGYHFKSIAAAGPIVGVITAANLWGWLPALLWLMIGVSFIDGSLLTFSSRSKPLMSLSPRSSTRQSNGCVASSLPTPSPRSHRPPAGWRAISAGSSRWGFGRASPTMSGKRRVRGSKKSWNGVWRLGRRSTRRGNICSRVG